MDKGETIQKALNDWNKSHFYICLKCSHEWFSSKDTPTICPECKTKKIKKMP